MSFPETQLADIASYADAYFSRLSQAAASVDHLALDKAAQLLTDVYQQGGVVYTCGNGASASIANHFVCDHSKMVQTDTSLKPRIVSLCTNMEILTAIGNDVTYDDVFVYQIRSLAKPGDALVTISSSGNSENIVRAAGWAKENGIPVIAMTGFSGGRSAQIADANVHVDSDNYGLVEDAHQSLMHILAQFIRQSQMDRSLVGSRQF